MAERKRRRPDRGEYRSLFVALVDDGDFQSLSAQARAVFYPLKLKLGQAGIDVFYPEMLPRLTGLSPAECEAALQELHATDWIRSERNVFWIRNGLAHEPSDPLTSPNNRRGIELFIRTLPKLDIVAEFARYYDLEAPFEPKQEPRSNPVRTPSSPVDTETETQTDDRNGELNKAAAAVPSHAHTHEATAAAAADVEKSGEESAEALELRTRREMAIAVDEHAKSIDDVKLRSRFVAGASPLVDGSDYPAWQDPNGDRIPWEDRPRFLKLALAHHAATNVGLRSALRYIIPQQTQPFAAKRNNGPKPGSEGAQFAAGDPKPARNSAPVNPMIQQITGALSTRVAFPDPTETNHIRRQTELKDAAAWCAKNPDAQKAIQAEILEQFTAERDRWTNASEADVQVEAQRRLIQKVKEHRLKLAS